MNKVQKFFKRLWNWLKKLFGRKSKAEEPEEVETEELIPEETEVQPKGFEEKNPVVETLDETDVGSQELLGNRFSLSGECGFIKLYSTKEFDTVRHEHFHSIDELLSCLNNRKNNHALRGCDNSHSETFSFTGTRSYKEAVQLLRDGYVSILPSIKSGVQQNVNKLKELFLESKSKPISAVVGVSPNVPRYLMGVPHSMDDRTRDVQKVKTINIIYVSNSPWHVGKEDFVKSGIAILSAIQLLENSGISISLSCAMYSGYSRGEAVIGTVQLKDYKDRLDLKKLCFPIAHPSMFRRIGFRFLETIPGLKNEGFAYGYGKATSHSENVEMLKTSQNIVVLSLPLVRETLNFDVKRIIGYIKEDARR